MGRIEAHLPVDEFDPEGFDLGKEKEAILNFAKEMATQSQRVQAELDQRLSEVQQLLAQHQQQAQSTHQVETLAKAGKAMLGEEFTLVPEFILPDNQANEWQNAWGDSPQLLQYLQTDPIVQTSFPLDQWMYGVARVREKIWHWENINFLSEALGGQTPELHPIQLPYQPNDHWLAMDFPDTYKLDREKLLYTAHYSQPFDHNRRQCGLLVDEWTEVIPEQDETTGLSFHYDRPNFRSSTNFLVGNSSQV